MVESIKAVYFKIQRNALKPLAPQRFHDPLSTKHALIAGIVSATSGCSVLVPSPRILRRVGGRAAQRGIIAALLQVHTVSGEQ
jgi:hypothetical protein